LRKPLNHLENLPVSTGPAAAGIAPSIAADVTDCARVTAAARVGA
jgi:hypothetical protein